MDWDPGGKIVTREVDTRIENRVFRYKADTLVFTWSHSSGSIRNWKYITPPG
jgi:hypothetical protein